MKVFLVGQLISFTLLLAIFGLFAAMQISMTFPLALIIGILCGIVGTLIAAEVLDE